MHSKGRVWCERREEDPRKFEVIFLVVIFASFKSSMMIMKRNLRIKSKKWRKGLIKADAQKWALCWERYHVLSPGICNGTECFLQRILNLFYFLTQYSSIFEMEEYLKDRPKAFRSPWNKKSKKGTEFPSGLNSHSGFHWWVPNWQREFHFPFWTFSLHVWLKTTLSKKHKMLGY
jgi:hypothetical protein